MPINEFGNNSINSEHKLDTSLFVQKPYLRSNYKEDNFVEDIDMKNQVRFNNLPDSTSVRQTFIKINVDKKINDPSKRRNIDQVDFNDKISIMFVLLK